jgi:hypothetical protein
VHFGDKDMHDYQFVERFLLGEAISLRRKTLWLAQDAPTQLTFVRKARNPIGRRAGKLGRRMALTNMCANIV